jgi:D-arabinan endo alpha-(1,5)-arabinofuranosidase
MTYAHLRRALSAHPSTVTPKRRRLDPVVFSGAAGRLLFVIGHLSLFFTLMIDSTTAGELQPRITSIATSKVCALTGPQALTDQKEVDVCGTDLGIMTELNGRIYFAFGDTFGYEGDSCRGVGGPNWRSNVFGSTADLDPTNGVRLTDWLHDTNGRAIAIVQGAHQPPFAAANSEQTKIPTSMVTVGGTIYLHYMSVRGFAPKGGVWECNYSAWVYTDDLGKTWHECAVPFGPSNFNMLALTAAAAPDNPDGEYVYALGTPCGRFGAARLGRVPQHHILEFGAWEYLVGSDGTGGKWTKNFQQAINVLPAPIGEASVLWNPAVQRWMYTYLNENTASLELRESEHLWGPWAAPHALASAHDYPQLYGAFMTPSFLRDNGRVLYFVMSQFGPYNTFIMKAELRFANSR